MEILSPGTTIGQYEIASRPMMGGMGVVYFALDHGNDGLPVALKTFRPELLPDRAARDRFLREGTAWIELGSHPHIVRCYKVEYTDPTAFLVLELIAKEQNMPDASLRSWLIPGRPLPLEQALLFALQIARGMQYATEKIPGFVHRDLKPENILVGVDKLPGTNINRLRVTDFGLVKTIADSRAPTTSINLDDLKPNQVQFTQGVGTPLYMAPEQWKGEPVGVFTDIYAFGCIFYEMVAGQHAMDGKTIHQLQVMHCGGKLQPFPKSLSKDVEALLVKCLTPNPIQRFDNWGELLEIIENSYSTQSGTTIPYVEKSAGLDYEERKQVGWSYNAMGGSYYHMGMAAVAASYFEKALNMMRETGDQHGEGAALVNLGLAYADVGDAQRAIDCYEKAIVISREIGDRRWEGNAICNLGLAYADLSDEHRAIGYYEQYLVIAREIGDRRGEGSALGNLGTAYLNLGDVRRAIEYDGQSLAIDREIGDRRGEGTTLCNLGLAYADLGDMQQAITYYKQALAISHEIGDRHGEGNALGNLGSAYLTLGDAQWAISYYEQSLDLSIEIDDKYGKGGTLGNLGSAYAKLGDMQRSMEFYERSLVIMKEIGNINGAAMISFNLATSYAQQGNPARALLLAEEAAAAFVNIGHPEYIRRAQQLILALQGNDGPRKASPVRAAFDAFQHIDSPRAMQIAVEQYPFMKDDQFIQVIEQAITEQVSIKLKPAFEQRLTWLKQIAGK